MLLPPLWDWKERITGYPMSYPRVVMRNGLSGNYRGSGDTEEKVRAMIAGDMRRLEQDVLDDRHIERYAAHVNISRRKARKILEAFFTDFGAAGQPAWLGADCWGESNVIPLPKKEEAS